MNKSGFNMSLGSSQAYEESTAQQIPDITFFYRL